MRVLLSVALLLSLTGVASAKGPNIYHAPKTPAFHPAVTSGTTISAPGATIRIGRSGNSGRSNRNNNAGNARQPGWYDYFAGRAVQRSQQLYGPVPGAGGMQFIGGDDMPGTPAYIVNPFCQPEFGHNHGTMPEIIENPFCSVWSD